MSGAVREKNTNPSDNSPSMEEILMSIRSVIAGIKESKPNSEFDEDNFETQSSLDNEVLELTDIVDETGNSLSKVEQEASEQLFKNTKLYSNRNEALKEQELSIIEDIDSALNNIESQFKSEAKVNNNSDNNSDSSKAVNNNPVSSNFPEASFLNDEVTKKTASSLQSLVSQINSSKQKNVPSANGTTLESLVTDILTPHLAQWMNNNLPALVEKIIEKEIKQIVEKHSLEETN